MRLSTVPTVLVFNILSQTRNSDGWSALRTRLHQLATPPLLTVFFHAAVLLLICCIGFHGTAIAQQAQPTLPIVELTMAGKTLKTELASTPNQRYMGLSFRKSMAENEAMLFVFPTEQPLTFTMRNTLIPLSIAYISDDLVIQEIHHMSVGPDQLFPSKAPARFALEVNQGWFKRNNVSIGSKISLGQ